MSPFAPFGLTEGIAGAPVKDDLVAGDAANNPIAQRMERPVDGAASTLQLCRRTPTNDIAQRIARAKPRANNAVSFIGKSRISKRFIILVARTVTRASRACGGNIPIFRLHVKAAERKGYLKSRTAQNIAATARCAQCTIPSGTCFGFYVRPVTSFSTTKSVRWPNLAWSEATKQIDCEGF